MSGGAEQETIEPGHTNRHAQRVIRITGTAGPDPLQTVYVLECEQCQHRYAAKGADFRQRRCPKCQSGKTGLPIDPSELQRDQ